MGLFAVACLLPIFCLLALVCLPSRIANVNVTFVRSLTTALVGLACLLAFLLVVGRAATGGTPQPISLINAWDDPGLRLSIYLDGAASLMLLLVTFVGFVVSRFSIRYLDGEKTQGRYFRWLGFTIGAVSLMVVAGNLLLFFAAWVATSFGLHQLLLHYRHRAEAHRAAWTKFAISRLGDAFLIGALVLTFKTFGTFELSELFAKANALDSSLVTASHTAIGWLLVLGAATKSAQFPFHSWLPDTMETPTPVSALMHAGIVNAGGFLIIRMSPLVALAPTALLTLALIGAFTACFAGVVMMTQPSVKRALAYSTIAQMGFMMLQCGFGAFSAALLHILAHSLYKAHAFLSSGSVVSHSMETTGAQSPALNRRTNLALLLGAAAATAAAFLAGSTTLGVNALTKPGGVVLAFILCLALTTWGWRLLSLGEARTVFTGIAGVFALCICYLVSYLAVQHLLGSPPTVSFAVPALQLVYVATGLCFLILFALHAIVVLQLRPQWLEPIRVHAANGFYIDALSQRLFASLAKS